MNEHDVTNITGYNTYYEYDSDSNYWLVEEVSYTDSYGISLVMTYHNWIPIYYDNDDGSYDVYTENGDYDEANSYYQDAKGNRYYAPDLYYWENGVLYNYNDEPYPGDSSAIVPSMPPQGDSTNSGSPSYGGNTQSGDGNNMQVNLGGGGGCDSGIGLLGLALLFIFKRSR